MANPLNVFKGPDSLKKYFDPDENPPLPLVELPDKLNPFREDGVRIYAKMLTVLPAQNVKALPALNMLLHNPSTRDKSIVEASSGSTVTSLGITARVLYDNDDTTAFCTNKTELNRLRQLQFFGIKVELYGGPAQPEFTDRRGIIERVRKLAREDENTANPAQYDNENNWKSHMRWTGPQIWKQLPEINLFCMGMGSTGCITGTGGYLKSHKPSVKVLGVCNAEADPVPGPRALPLFDSCSFPWRHVVDYTESIRSVESYRSSMRLSRNGIISGPSSGMAYEGLLNFLSDRKRAGTLAELADPQTGEISCVFVCCDLPQQYLNNYFEKLEESEFPPMVNKDLLSIDQDVYDLKWEIDPFETHRKLPSITEYLARSVLSTESSVETPNAELTVVDLRSASDFIACHVQGALNLPLLDITSRTKSPFDFDDTSQLHAQWAALKQMLEAPETLRILHGSLTASPVLVLCYNGDSSRIATAILRAQGVAAYSFYGGWPGLIEFMSEARRRAATPPEQRQARQRRNRSNWQVGEGIAQES